jgi:hypothetical protein
VINDSNTARIKAIRANTPFPVSVCILSCQNIKMEKSNYCDMKNIQNLQADKKVCESNKTKYVSFYIDKSEKNERTPAYLLAFVQDNELKRLVAEGAIAEELKRTADWLEITHDIIQCYIFCYNTTTPLTNIRIDTFALQKKLSKNNDSSYLIRRVPLRLPRVLCINGGSPHFDIIVQEA